MRSFWRCTEYASGVYTVREQPDGQWVVLDRIHPSALNTFDSCAEAFGFVGYLESLTGDELRAEQAQAAQPDIAF